MRANSGQQSQQPPQSRLSSVALQPQEVVLGWCGEYMDIGDRIWSGGLVMLLEQLGFTPGAARVALSRVIARGLLKRTREGQRIFYSMTPRLLPLLRNGKSQTYFFRDLVPWDGTWTLVWYSIPENDQARRRRLARQLSFQGFAALQDGTWVIPRDNADQISAIVNSLGLTRYVAIVRGMSVTGLEFTGPLKDVWRLDELNQAYQDFINAFAPLKQSDLAAKDSFVQRTRVIDSFRQLALTDPTLAPERIQPNWVQPDAVELFERLSTTLYPRAKEHFDSVTLLSASPV